MTDLPGLLLPPDPRAAALARRHLRNALAGTPLEPVLDDALVIVSELVTNAVVHAGTEVELHLRAEDDGLWLQVLDHLPGVVPLVRESDDERESGRGMVLLAGLASEWGTAHRTHSKAVWCRVPLPQAGERPAPERVLVRDSPAHHLDLGWVLELPPDLERRLPLRLVLRELLDRLCDAFDVERGAVLAVLEPGGDGEQVSRRGAGLTDREQHQVLALPGTQGRAVALGDLLVLPLMGRAGTVGAVVLTTAESLGPAARAVARIVADRLAVLVSDHHAERQRERDRGALALLAEASTLFAETLDVRLAATLTTQLVVPRFGTLGALVLLQEHGPLLTGLSSADESASGALRATLDSAEGRGLVQSLVARLAAGQPVPLPTGTALDRHARHALAVPLIARRRLLGVLLVGGARVVDGADASLLLDLARRAAMTIDNARVYEDRSDVARVLQESLLPSSLPTAVGVAFAARYAAAGDSQVGGDFYDVFSLPDGGFGLAVGDVCGKGPEAAAITGVARQVLRLSLREGLSLPAAYGRLNDSLLELGDRGRFLTSAAAVVHVVEQGVRVTLGNAGHPLPVHVRQGGVALVGKAGDLVGVMPSVAVQESGLLLRPGESLVFYTDGVTERRDGDVQYGEANLLRVLEQQAGGAVEALAGCVQDSVQRFSRVPPRDDLAVLVVGAL